MSNWTSRGRRYLILKIANTIALIFWLFYFVDGFLPAENSIEVIRDFEEFQLHSFSGLRRGSFCKKLITDSRTFTTYTDENGFFITDTLEWKLTPIFQLVVEYRQYSPRNPEKWIYHKLSSHHNPAIITTTIVLFLLTAYAIFSEKMKIADFKLLSLFTILGTFIFYLSLVT